MREAIKHKLGGVDRSHFSEMFGQDLLEYMSKQVQAISFLNIPILVRLCVDTIIEKGTTTISSLTCQASKQKGSFECQDSTRSSKIFATV